MTCDLATYPNSSISYTSEADCDIYFEADRLTGLPLNNFRDLERWVQKMKTSLVKYDGKLDTQSEQIIVDSIVNKINVNDLRKQLDWMIAYRGHTLSTVLGYLDLVVVSTTVRL